MTDDELMDELLAIAILNFPDEIDLAINTGDEDLFHNIMKAANRLLVSDTLSNLIEKGLVEIEGMGQDNEFYFTLTEKGKEVTKGMYDESDSGTKPED